MDASTLRRIAILVVGGFLAGAAVAVIITLVERRASELRPARQPTVAVSPVPVVSAGAAAPSAPVVFSTPAAVAHLPGALSSGGSALGGFATPAGAGLATALPGAPALPSAAAYATHAAPALPTPLAAAPASTPRLPEPISEPIASPATPNPAASPAAARAPEAGVSAKAAPSGSERAAPAGRRIYRPLVEPADARLRLVRDAWARTEPDPRSRTVERVRKRMYVLVTGLTADYVRVSLLKRGGETAYVPNSAVALVRPADKRMTLITRATLREKPYRYSRHSGTLPAGTTVHIVGVAVNYLKVLTADGREGFVAIRHFE